MFTLIHFDMGICFYLYELKMKNFQNFIYNMVWKIVRGWHHQLAHLNIHKDWSRNVFRKNVKFQNVIYFLISHPIFIIFSLFCRKKCTLSFKIDSILEWISPFNWMKFIINLNLCFVFYITKAEKCSRRKSSLTLIGNMLHFYLYKTFDVLHHKWKSSFQLIFR